MSFNGSGTFQPYVPGNPVVTGTVISSTAFNATISDIASGLSNAVTRDGQSPLTANLPAAGRKITGLGAGVVAGDSLRFEQLFSQGTEQDIASAATVDIGGLNTTIARITGTTTITSFGTNYNGPRFVRFAGALTLTHNATTLILPGGANITTAAGDRAILTPIGNPGSGWQVLAYEVAALAPGAANTATTAGTLSGTVAIANGGTGQTTAALAFTALKQDASETATGVVERLTTAEAQAGTDTTRYHSAATMKAAQIQLGTAVTASGTSVDFTGIPTWAKRVTVLFNALSTNGLSPPIAQLGAGSPQTSGYSFSAGDVNGANACGVASNGTGFALGGRYLPGASSVLNGLLQITKVTGNTWAVFGCAQNNAVAYFGGGTVAVSGDLDRIRLTTVAGTDSFDAGTVNISWE